MHLTAGGIVFVLGAWHRRRLLHGPCSRTTWPGMHAHLEHPSLVFFSCMPRARRRGAAPCPAAARCVHGNWNSYTVAAQPMGSSCKPFPLPGPAALGGVFTSPDRPTDPPAAVRAEGRRWMAALPLPQPRHIGGVGRAVGIGPPQPPRPIPARPSLYHMHWRRRRSLSPSAGRLAKGAAAASARANVLAMQAKCRSTGRLTRLPNQPGTANTTMGAASPTKNPA